ncbi:hypothetical protein HK098_002757 [Nowakowskiella sp. JEL0407]|nr:hypothetical protein HK098_002757 [Nowakowskiella sp. JEL0407]
MAILNSRIPNVQFSNFKLFRVQTCSSFFPTRPCNRRLLRKYTSDSSTQSSHFSELLDSHKLDTLLLAVNKKYSSENIDDFTDRVKFEIINRTPRSNELQHRYLTNLENAIESGDDNKALTVFNAMHPDFTGITSKNVQSLTETIIQKRAVRYSQIGTGNKVLELLYLVSKHFCTERSPEFYSMILNNHIISGRIVRTIEIWKDLTREGIKLDRDHYRGLYPFFNIIIPMFKGDRNGAYEQFSEMRKQQPRSIIPYVGLMLAISYSSRGLENLAELHDAIDQLESFSKRHGRKVEREHFFTYSKIFNDAAEYQKVLEVNRRASMYPVTKVSLAKSMNNHLMNAISYFRLKDQFESCLELWLLNPFISMNQSTFVRSIIAITRIKVSPYYTFRLTAQLETQLHAESVRLFTYSFYFAPALINSFQVNTAADLAGKITEYYSKNICLVSRTEIFSRLAGSFAILRDLNSMRYMLHLLEPYEENLRVDDAILVIKAPLHSFNAVDDEDAVFFAADEAIKYFKRIFPHYVRINQSAHYFFATHLIELLFEFQLYGHVKIVLSLYRKAGLKIYGSRLNIFKDIFENNEKGEKVNIFDEFRDVIKGNYS